MNFKVGDVVRLKGIVGPKMVVETVIEQTSFQSGYIRTVWFDDKNNLNYKEWFEPDIFEKENPRFVDHP